MKTQRLRRVATAIIVAVLFAVTFTGIYQVFPATRSARTTDDATNNKSDVTKMCTTDAATKYHIHPTLKIIIEGKEEAVPSRIGILPTCMRILHTHDTTGVIHVESPFERQFTLGEFFAVWGKPFDRTRIFDHTVDETHELVLTVNGKPNDRYEGLFLKDRDTIVIEYRKK